MADAYVPFSKKTLPFSPYTSYIIGQQVETKPVSLIAIAPLSYPITVTALSSTPSPHISVKVDEYVLGIP
jgi:hypothetical protein